MGLDDIAPHLNKISTLYLKNNKRKVGWLMMGNSENNDNESVSGTLLYFISVQIGKKMITEIANKDLNALGPFSEAIPIEMIERIRSSK